MSPMSCAECQDLLTTVDITTLWSTSHHVALPRLEIAFGDEPFFGRSARGRSTRTDGDGGQGSGQARTNDRIASMREHLMRCERCGAVATLVTDGERSLGRALASYTSAEEASPTSSRTASQIAEFAWASVHRAWYRRWLGAALSVAVLALLVLTVWYVLPEVRRMLAPPPPVVTETFSLRCLSPEQAASIVGPYIPTPQNPRWQAERFGVEPARGGIRALTVRAPHDIIELVPKLLSRFERDENAACRTGEAAGATRETR